MEQFIIAIAVMLIITVFVLATRRIKRWLRSGHRARNRSERQAMAEAEAATRSRLPF